MGRNIISLALFGKETKYADYLPAAVRAWKTLLPDFEIIVHHDVFANKSAYWKLLSAYAERGVVTLIAMGAAPKAMAMLWRLNPIWSPDVECVFARDMDSLPTPRERVCMLKFVQSEMALGVIHDSKQHVLMMGGLTSYRAKEFREAAELDSLDALYKRANLTDQQWAIHGVDQFVLNRFVAPQLSKLGLIYEHQWSGWTGAQAAEVPENRAPTYRGGISEPVPDLAIVPGHSPAWVYRAEQLVDHIGQAHYHWLNAAAFYDIEDTEWNLRIRYAERDAGYAEMGGGI